MVKLIYVLLCYIISLMVLLSLFCFLSIIYIIWLYPTEYKRICYFLQFIIIFCDIVISFYIIKYISKIVRSKKETLVRYNKNINPLSVQKKKKIKVRIYMRLVVCL